MVLSETEARVVTPQDRTMKPKKKKRGAVLLSIGGFFLLLAVFGLFDSKHTPQRRISNALGGITFGLPLLGLGGWQAWGTYQQQQQEKRDRLQSTFYRLLQENNGQIAALDFAMATQLSAQEAKQYLDEQAKEFDADFTVTQGNGICYQFETGKSAKHHLPIQDSQLEA